MNRAEIGIRDRKVLNCLNCNTMLSSNNKTGYCTNFCECQHNGIKYNPHGKQTKVFIYNPKEEPKIPVEVKTEIKQHYNRQRKTGILIDDLITENPGITIREYLEIKDELNSIERSRINIEEFESMKQAERLLKELQ